MPNESHITLRLADKNGDAALVMSRNDNKRLNMVQLSMRRVEPNGYHYLCQYLGDTMLRMLSIVHEENFAKFPRLVPPKLHTDTPYGVVDALIQRSYKEKTTEYIPTIDRIIQNTSAEDLDETNLSEHWQGVRANLLESFRSDPA